MASINSLLEDMYGLTVPLSTLSAAAQYVVTHPQTSHNPINLDFLLHPLSKIQFLS
jgi:hypothetical protein